MAAEIDRMFSRTPRREARRRVVSFPHAGGTSALYEPLRRALRADIELCAFEPPGRQRRMREPLAARMDELLAPLLATAPEWLDRPCVFLGHSLGSWMAFELARQLRDRGHGSPLALVLSGARAPQLPRRAALSQLPDDAFTAELRAMNGTPREVLDDADLMACVLPRIRADFALAERYAPEPAGPLALPFVVLGGTEDPTVQPSHLRAWSAFCAGSFELHMLPGDHFFIQRHERAVAQVLERCFDVAERGSARREITELS